MKWNCGSLQWYSVMAWNSDRRNLTITVIHMSDMKSSIPVFKLGPVHTGLHMSPLISKR